MARIDPDKRVYVYFNLHKKCFSVKQSGKVVSHDDCVLLKDCRFLVGDAGRERVLKEKKTIKGNLTEKDGIQIVAI